MDLFVKHYTFINTFWMCRRGTQIYNLMQFNTVALATSLSYRPHVHVCSVGVCWRKFWHNSSSKCLFPFVKNTKTVSPVVQAQERDCTASKARTAKSTAPNPASKHRQRVVKKMGHRGKV